MRTPAPALAIASMGMVQLGAALSTHLFDAVTPAGSAWLRLAVAGVVLLALTRPRGFSRRDLLATALLGAVTGMLTLAFIEAVARIPLGTVVAVEFLGPLGVAAARAHRKAALVWPVLALAGVLALTSPWAGDIDLAGVGFALAAAAGWAAYLVLTQRIGASVSGLGPLAVSLTVGALVTAPLAVAPVLAGLTWSVALAGIGLAVLTPLLPYALELMALRRMTLTAFGTLMALEPGIATVLGLALLSQAPSLLQAVGVLLVVVAGIGAQRTGRTPAAGAPEPAGLTPVAGAPDPAGAPEPAGAQRTAVSGAPEPAGGQCTARTAAASVATSVEGRSQTNPRQTYAAA